MPKLTLRSKLFVNFIVISLIVLLLSTLINYRVSSRELEKSVGANISKSAADIADKIDRNLFERYGDVQAFQYNKIPSAANRDQITAFMNNMMGYYAPIYQLMLMTDLKGRVVAVNNVDKANKPIDTKYLIGKDFSSSNWFKTVMSGQIKPGQAFVEDPKYDEDVKKVYPDSNGYAMKFSSPVYDGAGKIIGAWTNRMDVANINQIILDNLKVEQDRGLETAKVDVLSQGNITIYDEDSREMDKNGLEKLAPKVKALIESQKDSFIIEDDKIYGIVRSKGFSTYPARNWAVIFSVDYDDAMKGLANLKYANGGIFVLALLIATGLTLLATKSIVAPVEGLVAVAEQVSRGDLAARLPESFLRSDQRLAEAFSKMIDNLRSLITQVQGAANHVALASEELSENAGQTTKATQQIASAIEDLTRGNTDQVAYVEQTVTRVGELTQAIEAIAGGAAEQMTGIEETSGIIEEMVTGIDEVNQNTQKIAQSANQSAEAAGLGSSAVENTVRGMHQIKETRTLR